ncbi:hypothetical protein JMG10_49605, partial [Nostoc ellipsosporum NOK]|nr:hypothetical protein [Nostoc ellipsosporum NOK]
MLRNFALVAAASAIALLASSADAQKLAKPSAGQRLQDQTASDVPHCTRKLGTLSIVDGDDPRP